MARNARERTPRRSMSRLYSADGTQRTRFGHRPSRGHSLRVRDVRHGDEAYRQRRRVAGLRGRRSPKPGGERPCRAMVSLHGEIEQQRRGLYREFRSYPGAFASHFRGRRRGSFASPRLVLVHLRAARTRWPRSSSRAQVPETANEETKHRAILVHGRYEEHTR